jgi:hypothetical protein
MNRDSAEPCGRKYQQLPQRVALAILKAQLLMWLND